MNQLTPEQLDMIKRLQPLFREKMGVITEGDMFLNPFRKKICFVDKGTLVIDGCFVIPKPIDWQNPERGLWNILDSSNRYADKIMCDDPFTALLMALVQQEGV